MIEKFDKILKDSEKGISEKLEAYREIQKQVSEYADALLRLEISALDETQASEEVRKALVSSELGKEICKYNLFQKIVEVLNQEEDLKKERFLLWDYGSNLKVCEKGINYDGDCYITPCQYNKNYDEYFLCGGSGLCRQKKVCSSIVSFLGRLDNEWDKWYSDDAMIAQILLGDNPISEKIMDNLGIKSTKDWYCDNDNFYSKEYFGFEGVKVYTRIKK